MNQRQKDLIKKLNKDNEALSKAHQSWTQYAKGRILIGVILVIILIILMFIEKRV